MKNRILLREDRLISVKGHVILDYVREGKILERVEGDNMCFDSSFNGVANWYDHIEKVSAHLMLYNTDKAPDPEMPYQRRGNVIGWGYKGQVASGTVQGAWNAAKSYDNKIINDGNGISFKWAYDFGVTQMVGMDIKSLGVGYGHSRLYLNRYERSNFNLTGFLAKGYLGYIASFSGTNRLINVRSLKQQLVFNDINVAAFVKTDNVSDDNWAIGFATDTDKAYVLLYNGNAAQSARRILYEFADDTFTVLTNTYNVTNTPFLNSSDPIRGFLVYGNKMYLPNSNVVEFDFVANTTPVTFVMPTSPINIGQFNSGGVNSAYSAGRNGVAFKGKYMFRLTQDFFVPIFNMETKKYEPEAPYFPSATNNYFAAYIEPMVDGSPLVVTSGNSTMPYSVFQMLTCYTLPPDAPARPEDSGVSVDYQIDINYV